MTKRIASLAFLPLLLMVGCDGNTIDPGCTENCEPACEGEDCTDPNPDPDGNGSLIVDLPDNVPAGTILVNGEARCDNDCSLELEAATYSVGVDCPGHLFLEKTAEVESGQDAMVSWSAENGEVGLAPNGTYRAEDHDEFFVTTEIVDGEIVIDINDLLETVVTGNTFFASNLSGEGTMEGTISEDLTTIQIDYFYLGEPDGSDLLTLID